MVRFLKYMVDAFPSALFKDLCHDSDLAEIVHMLLLKVTFPAQGNGPFSSKHVTDSRRQPAIRWILSQSEQAAIARKCEKMAGLHDAERLRKDLDQTVWLRDERAVKSIIECIDEMVNPFSQDNSELLNISSRVVAMASVSRDLLDAHD
ncbi:hypothetical protein EOD39_9570 [Acipenser ruthenus]|uniref:Uncharacterized protein n=1 Tax=Acipenser ruthenus TaxID=7906 RepID=A0A662YUV3_ACIRT|nr:hypothetical protein EOD39_9570 [Acipenser ruthenus]